MITRRTTKGQSIVIGFMLILALSIALFGWFQVTQLPEINRDAEIKYETQVESDMTEFRTALWEVTRDPDTEVMPVQVKTTVEYPFQSSRTDASTAQLSFTTLNNSAYSFENSDPVGVVNDVSTVKIDHEPTLFVRQPSTTSIENNVVFTENQAGIVQPIGSQLMISESKIYLTQLNADSNSIVSNDPEFVLREASRDATTMTADDTSQPIVLKANTTLSTSFWQDQLGDIDSVNSNDVTVSNGVVEIPLDSSKTYEVIVSRINIDED